MAASFKPYQVLLFAALLYLISIVFVDQKIEINLAYTYFSIDYTLIVAFICGLLLIFAGLYKYLNKYFSIKLLTWLHIMLSIVLPFFAVWMSHSFHKSLALIELTDIESMDYILNHQKKLNQIILTFIVIQTLPLINVLVSLIRMKYSTAKV
jgi:hypothetical protein